MEQKEHIKEFDFVKGFAIISVILLHAFGDFNDEILSAYSIGQAVPLFIMVSCLLGYFSFSNNTEIRQYFTLEKIKRMLKRIFLPYVSAQIIIVLPLIVTGNITIKGFIAGGGIGPGSYYPWIYLQLWILLPIMYLLLRKNPAVGSIVILGMTILGDILFSLFIPRIFNAAGFNSSPEWLYRLFASRYLFIFVLSYLLFTGKVKYIYLLILAIMGAGLVYYLKYMHKGLEPVFYNSGWSGENFYNHFYTLIIFIFLYKIYKYLPEMIKGIFCIMGEYSWEIFLMQMIYFRFNGILHLNKYVNVFFALFVCIVPLCTYKFMAEPIQMKKNIPAP